MEPNLAGMVTHDRGDGGHLRRLPTGPGIVAWADLELIPRFRADPGRLDAIIADLRPVAAQRWPRAADRQGRWHDVMIEDRSGALWVRFSEAATGGAAELHLELRPISAGDIPAVGLVDDARVAYALGYLSDCFADAPSLDEVAAAVHTSPFHFHRLFRRVAGMTPKQYLMRMQLQIARRMLRATSAPIGEIARATGFASHGHFTATFRRSAGMSPSAYRTAARGGKGDGGRAG